MSVYRSIGLPARRQGVGRGLCGRAINARINAAVYGYSVGKARKAQRVVRVCQRRGAASGGGGCKAAGGRHCHALGYGRKHAEPGVGPGLDGRYRAVRGVFLARAILDMNGYNRRAVFMSNMGCVVPN